MHHLRFLRGGLWAHQAEPGEGTARFVSEQDTVGRCVACSKDQVAMSLVITASTGLDEPCARQDLAPLSVVK
jgi:hypothetical protein